MMMRSILFILTCCCALTSCIAQHNIISAIRKGGSYTAKGYLINLYGKNGSWFFQPCNDSSKGVWQALDNNAFIVQNIEADLGYTFFDDLDGLGSKLPIAFHDNIDKREKKDTLTYLYCKITLEVVDTPYRLNTCGYILPDNKRLSCFFFQNYLTVVEPLEPEIRKKYLQPFYDKGWPLPEWVKPKSKPSVRRSAPTIEKSSLMHERLHSEPLQDTVKHKAR